MMYSSYGLNIRSELNLPELLPSELRGITPPDVIIELGEVSPVGLSEGNQLGPYLWVADQSLWLHVPDVARFLITNGNKIVIDPEPGIDEDSIRVFLLGSGFGALLFQRGYLVLHGNAISFGDKCMICLGHSGAGKSTLAAGFLQRGYDILADDVVPIDVDGCVLPGIPSIKLWQDAANKLGIETAQLRRTRPHLQKFKYMAPERWTGQRLPVRWAYVLNQHPKQEIHFDTIRGLRRFENFSEHIYRNQFMLGEQLKAHCMRISGQIAGHIHMSKVSRPTDGFDLDGLIDGILADIKTNP
jgi:hypothetical protein